MHSPCNWSMCYGSCVTELLPSDRQLRLEIRMQSTWLWIARSNLFHSRAVHPPKRMDYYRTVCRNMCRWSILGDSVCRLHSNSLPVYGERRKYFTIIAVVEVESANGITLILPPHLSHGGARNCSKQNSQYKSPFSSTKPISWSGLRQVPFTQTKWSGHQIRPNAVINGPLHTFKSKKKKTERNIISIGFRRK